MQCIKQLDSVNAITAGRNGRINFEVTNMDYKANRCIACTVEQCTHHCSSENYCSLDKIQVGTHESNPTVKQCTDCMSFELKASN